MEKIRELLRTKPWIGWAFAGVMLVIAFYFAFFRGSTDQFGPARMQETVTIKYADTGETVDMPRGRFLKKLLEDNPGKLDPAVGLINPSTNKPTGFLFDKSEWDKVVAELNQDKEAAAKGPGQGGANKVKPKIDK